MNNAHSLLYTWKGVRSDLFNGIIYACDRISFGELICHQKHVYRKWIIKAQ